MRIIVMAALASMSAPTVAAAQVQAPAKEDKVVCKRQYEPDTGSHFRNSKRVCMKQSEWKELEYQTDLTMRNMRERGGQGDNVPAKVGGGS